MTEKAIKTMEEIGDARLRRMLGAPPLPRTPPLPAGERKHGGQPLPVPLLKACRLPSTEQQLELNLSVARWLLSAALPPLARLHEVGRRCAPPGREFYSLSICRTSYIRSGPVRARPSSPTSPCDGLLERTNPHARP